MLWTSDSNPARGFRIYYSTSNKEPGYGKDSYFAISDGKVREAYVDGKAAQTYYYRICKFTGSGCDAYTPAVSHTYPGTAAKPTSTQVAATPRIPPPSSSRPSGTRGPPVQPPLPGQPAEIFRTASR